ncbi:RNA polymerase subunit sigma-70, partial [Flavobacteriaceae bacterium]|nr:RNA polymerase subunit sigma-70 [Flavobacteriaceae bacterium]
MPLAIENNFVDQIEALRDKIFRVTKLLLISSDEAADATQEVIIKLWQLDQNDRKIENMEAYSMT